jgi:predicted PurR-regulated permease PerM
MTGVIYGIIGTGIVQAVLTAFGLWICGIPGAFLLGVATFFLSLIPVGAPLVWLPASLWLFYTGATGWAIFLFVWGAVVVSSADNIIKPYFISRGSDLPFILVFLGALGGVISFGFLGIFLGPTLLAVGYNLIRDWAWVKTTEPA